ncbi:MAG TPA: ATP-dependent RNA helicase HrpA, partial [Casimicrobiaceae bacterium]|nr:ATP-dependent RNA helicase HrpA [Casimicrobiaceae bacterium]
SPVSSQSIAGVLGRLSLAMATDAARLRRRIERLRNRTDGAEWEKLRADLERSISRREARRARKPVVVYPPELPVAQRAEDIAALIRDHRVVIVSGETGSGKTTQLPKICLQAGRGEGGLIGHTQPRRIAARAVASRIAQELGTNVGGAVGYKVRFTDQTQPDAYIKLMTDGILLAETQGDRDLLAYDTIIVDEAHERSLNIDFLIGYLRQLLARRDDLRVVITSATLDAQRFAEHFAHRGKPAPIVEVSGRMYPVEIRHRPLRGAEEESDDEEEVEEGIVAVAEDLWREGPGDILVFLPGEREIRETSELLTRSLARRPYAADVEILPLYARLSVQEQQRVFASSQGRRIVLATNVAETSLTVPGIRYVIDTGLARVKRYSLRNKTTLLQIEKISQAAARQRAGRSGRVQNGICVRLYGEEDYAERPAFTDPEILRSSLAAVVLRMAALDLGPVEAFPFLEPPAPRAIADGYQLLQELGAVDAQRVLTPLGRELARLPLDPRIGRIVIAARDEGCLAEALVIASALAVPDPRDRPLDKRQAADQAHLRFRDERSDFLSLIALWEFFADALAQKMSHRRLVDHCRAQFVSYLRLREWRDVHAQLASVLSEAGWRVDGKLPDTFDTAHYVALHRALLAGLLGNIGMKPDAGDEYQGARGIRFVLHPGSGLAKKPPKWVLAAELTETTRLFARCAAKIEPEWIEAVAGDRVTRDYFDAHWDESRGEVVASERVQLFGLPLVARRPIALSRVDPATAHEIFVREALGPGTLKSKGAFLAHNRALIAQVTELEHMARRQDVLVAPETIASFYAQRVPAEVHSLVTFERWREAAEERDPHVLHLSREYLMRHSAVNVTEELFPRQLAMAGTMLPLKYRFAPGHPLDGLTLTVPLALLNQVDEARLTWLVPGMVREKVTAYLKALPKTLRNRLVPLPDSVTQFLATDPPRDRSLTEALRTWLGERLREPIAADVWDGIELAEYLRVNVRVVDGAGKGLGEDRDLSALRSRLGEAAQLSFATAGPALEKSGLRSWDFGDLPQTLAVTRKGQRLTGYPALVDEGDSVALTLLDTADAAEAATRAGVIRLIALQLAQPVAQLAKGPPGFHQPALTLRAVIPTERLLTDVVAAVWDRAFIGEDALPRNARAFAEQVKRARTRLPAVAEGAVRLLAAIATEHQNLTQKINALPPALGRVGAEVRAQRDALVYPGFFSATPWNQLNHLPRYLEALRRRLAKYPERRDRDLRHAEQVAAWWNRYQDRLAADRAADRHAPDLEAFRWLIEELRVSLFAQELRTPYPVSFKRLEKAWKDLDR